MDKSSLVALKNKIASLSDEEKIDDVNDCCVVAVDDLEHGSGSVPHINVVQSEESLLLRKSLRA